MRLYVYVCIALCIYGGVHANGNCNNGRQGLADRTLSSGTRVSCCDSKRKVEGQKRCTIVAQRYIHYSLVVLAWLLIMILSNLARWVVGCKKLVF